MLDPMRGYVDPDDIASLTVEPVQGDGGYRFTSDAFAEEVRAVYEDDDALLVADEVRAGRGRTDERWRTDHSAFEDASTKSDLPTDPTTVL
ncbi:MAG: aminotransferase class III-fold pyridoxal phosphate-dependent enzyme [archaeon]